MDHFLPFHPLSHRSLHDLNVMIRDLKTDVSQDEKHGETYKLKTKEWP